MSPWLVPGFAQERELGAGASGRVVAAVSAASGTRVAIKYLSSRLLGDPGFLEAFRGEAAILRALDVPQVVRLLDYVEAPGQGAAIVMELVDGVSLHEMITGQGPASPESALLVLKGSLLGLAAAHAAGIVHRDYKPENVLVDGSGQSKLADFGVAVRAGDRGPAGGTPLYMAPEQWDGAAATPASDIYAATAVFFECLTGKTPFSGGLGQLAAQHAAAAVPVEMVAEPLRELITRGMAKSPAGRPADASAFLAELEATATAAYGEDWESRGRGQLAERAAALLMLMLGQGGAAVGAGAGTTAAQTLLPKVAAGARAGLHGWQIPALYAGLFAGVFAVVAATLIGISAAKSGSSSGEALQGTASSGTAAPRPPAPSAASPSAASPSNTAPTRPSATPTATTPAAGAGPAPVTAQDLLSAPVPASCQHPAGRLVNGALPGIPANQGVMELAWLDNLGLSQSAGEAFGALAGTGDAAAVLYCYAGGVSWPEIIAFYGPGPRLLAWRYLTDFNLPGISGQSEENAFAYRIAYQSGGVYAEWSTQENGDPGARDSADYSATLKLSGTTIVASSVVAVAEQPTALAFAGDLRAGDQAAADALAASGVGDQAASLFSTYPSALAATPTCYGLGDLSMPPPLASLVESGGPDQVSQNTDRLCAFPSSDPGASWVALGLQKTGWHTWQVLWARAVSLSLASRPGPRWRPRPPRRCPP